MEAETFERSTVNCAWMPATTDGERIGGRFRPARLMAAAVVLVALVQGACSPLSTLNAFVPNDGYDLTDGLSYGPGERHKLDVYTPANGSGADRVVIFFYGGAFRFGEREDYRFVGQSLTSRNYVAVVPDYRLYPEVQFPAFVEDGAGVVRWVRDNIALFGGDPDQIYLMGHSAGAYIAALLSVDERYLAGEGLDMATIRGTVGLAGPYAFLSSKSDVVRDVFATVTSPGQAQPVTYVRGHEAPMLLMHGTADRIVYPTNSTALTQRIEDAGGQVRHIQYAELDHSEILVSLASPFHHKDNVFEDAAAFIAGN